eukprot:2538244-Karenia_brevis.AAC.1
MYSLGFSPDCETPHLLRPRPAHGSTREDGSQLNNHDDDNPDQRRPADVYVPRYRSGTPAAFDFAIT